MQVEKLKKCLCGAEIKEEQKECHSCFMQRNNLREIERNEVVFDVDNREIGFQAINEIAVRLSKEGYKFMIYYAKGQKSPHLHLKEIPKLDLLNREQLKKYKEMMLVKYTPEYALAFVDKSLCGVHCVACEEMPHFKYETEKRLIGVYNENNQNFRDEEIFNKIIEMGDAKERTMVGSGIEGENITSQIASKISIIFIAEKFGIKVGGDNMACCPFHQDDTPSMKFYEMQGRCHCFGCGYDGSIIKFYDTLKKLKLSFVLSKK